VRPRRRRGPAATGRRGCARRCRSPWRSSRSSSASPRTCSPEQRPQARPAHQGADQGLPRARRAEEIDRLGDAVWRQALEGARCKAKPRPMTVTAKRRPLLAVWQLAMRASRPAVSRSLCSAWQSCSAPGAYRLARSLARQEFEAASEVLTAGTEGMAERSPAFALRRGHEQARGAARSRRGHHTPATDVLPEQPPTLLRTPCREDDPSGRAAGEAGSATAMLLPRSRGRPGREDAPPLRQIAGVAVAR
jgi:hypothetical protein